MTLGIESEEQAQPETYYTDLLVVANPTSSDVTVTSVTVNGLSEARPGDMGGLTVFYCFSQTDAPQARCGASFTASGTAGGTVFSGADTIPPGGARYIEVAGFAGTSARPGDTMGFVIEVTAA